MHQPVENPSREERDALAVRQDIMRVFTGMLHSRGLPAMVVLQYAAAAVGSVYREVADAHTWPQSCPCGWQPDELADISSLQMALAREAWSGQQQHLATLPVAGHG